MPKLISADKYLFNISGPYAVGKDTILNALLSTYGSCVHRVHTITTRPVSRTADPTYEQVSPEQFKKRVSSGRWIANYQLSGLTAYATSVDEIEAAAREGQICIHSVYAGGDGAGKLREIFDTRAYSIGLLPAQGSAKEQLDILRDRLLTRSRDDPSAIEARLRHQENPLQYVIDNPWVKTQNGLLRVFDEVLINEDLQETVREVLQLFENTFLKEVSSCNDSPI